ncbi:MAG: hypothetical protein J0H09_02905, partial [Burkholderiales bacterium]|nr:hypothetical protein [Burkholderiales bacterium]
VTRGRQAGFGRRRGAGVLALTHLGVSLHDGSMDGNDKRSSHRDPRWCSLPRKRASLDWRTASGQPALQIRHLRSPSSAGHCHTLFKNLILNQILKVKRPIPEQKIAALHTKMLDIDRAQPKMINVATHKSVLLRSLYYGF